MTQPNARWWIKHKDEEYHDNHDEDQGIVTRYVITGTLVLETPAHFGNGEADALSDMPLMRDPLEGKALLTGASMAGALRNYLREYEKGYQQAEVRSDLVVQLFGHNISEKRAGERDKYVGFASLLTIDDALGESIHTELRDGVRIDPKTRTAIKGALYNFEVLAAGTTFNLRFELAIPQGKDGGRFDKDGAYHNELLQALAIALHGLEKGDIRLGKRKHRGFGQCQVTGWQVKKYEMKTDLVSWLTRPVEGIDETAEKLTSIEKLSATPDVIKDKRDYFELCAKFNLDGSLLIRSTPSDVNAPDVVHLCSNGQPIIPGTSWGGVIRARALRIVNTLGLNESFTNKMFGSSEKDEQGRLTASRVQVQDTQLIGNFKSLVQNRVKIDRFTGGSYPTALFQEQPIWSVEHSEVTLTLTLINPQPAEIGLLLHILKDLWTGDLPIGGELSVGRGRLCGQEATLTLQSKEPGKWVITQNGTGLKIDGDMKRLDNEFANALQKEASHAESEKAA